MTAEEIGRVRAANDRLRQTFQGGQVLITAGVLALDPRLVAETVHQVRTLADFQAGNDPHAEHDFGAIDLVDGTRVFWKIDYYNETLTHWHDPRDAACQRVLTICLSWEY